MRRAAKAKAMSDKYRGVPLPGIEPGLLAQKPPSTPLNYGQVHFILHAAQVPAIYRWRNKTLLPTVKHKEMPHVKPPMMK